MKQIIDLAPSRRLIGFLMMLVSLATQAEALELVSPAYDPSAAERHHAILAVIFEFIHRNRDRPIRFKRMRLATPE